MLNFKQEHPKGLYLLFFVEMWERFSYYGMRALIVLYMIQNLAFSTQKAGNIYGLYTGLVYLTPLIGGYIADKYFGQRKCISAGAFLMILGLSLLAFGPKSLFLLSLFLMIIANGLFKSNISSVLGILYKDKPEKKDSAFTIFYMGINLGAFFSPLICGTLAIKYGYEYGFASAGIGMLIGLVLYKCLENKLLGDSGTYPINVNNKNIKLETDNSIDEMCRLKALITLMLFTIPFWICFEQAGSSLTLFAQYQTNRNFMGYEIPTGYFQSLNPLFIILLAPIISSFWGFLRKYAKEPSSVEKFAIALFLISFSFSKFSLFIKFICLSSKALFNIM
jgi:POT family proton-dependent oligopeptide transporter